MLRVFIFFFCFKHVCNACRSTFTMAALKFLSDNSNISANLGLESIGCILIRFKTFLLFGMKSDLNWNFDWTFCYYAMRLQRLFVSSGLIDLIWHHSCRERGCTSAFLPAGGSSPDSSLTLQGNELDFVWQRWKSQRPTQPFLTIPVESGWGVQGTRCPLLDHWPKKAGS